MSCNDFEELLSGYIDGELPEEQKKIIRQRIQSDDAYQENVASLSWVKRETQSLDPPPVSDLQWQKFEQNWQKKTFPRISYLRKAASIIFILSAFFLTMFLNTRLDDPVNSQKISSLLDRFAEADMSLNEQSHDSMNISANIPRYSIDRNIKGISQANLKEKEIDFLVQNGFVVSSKEFTSFLPIYQDNQQRRISSFITVEMAMSGLSHILTRLRLDMEKDVFYHRLQTFTHVLTEQLLSLHYEVPKEFSDSSLRALAFIRVAEVLLNCQEDSNWPEEVLAKITPKVTAELELIYSKENEEKPVEIKTSPIFGYSIDYNKFKKNPSEAKNKKLQRYRQAYAWFARCIFRASEEHISEVRSALLILMASIGGSADGIIIWEEIHRVLTTLYGEPDDPHLLNYLQVARNVFGETLTVDILSQNEKVKSFCRKAARVHLPKIRSEIGLERGLRVFGGPDTGIDSILQQLSYPYTGKRDLPRITPSLVDIAVVMGYQKAIEVAKEKEFFEYKGYEGKVERLHRSLRNDLVEEKSPWQKGGFLGNAWMYEALLQPEGKGYPLFSRSEAWNARKLTTLVCGMLDDDDLINGKPRFVGESSSYFRGTIDPYPEFFNRMATKIRQIENLLQRVDYPTNRGPAKELLHYRQAIEGLAQAAAKILANKNLEEEDHNNLRNFALGWQGEYDSSAVINLSTRFYRNWTHFDEHLYVGTGPIQEIWIAIPVEGELQLARGGIFSLYEFYTVRQVSQEFWQSLKNKPGKVSWSQEYQAKQD